MISKHLIILIIAIVYSAEGDEKTKPCNLAFKCTIDENVVWATEGTECKVFQNGCIMSSENCSRQNRYLPEFVKVPKEECQKLCKDICHLIDEPICGQYKGKFWTFGNECELKNHICRTGEPFYTFERSSCKTDDPSE